MTTAPDRIFRSSRVVAGGRVRPAAVHVAGGAITAVAAHDELPAGCPIVELGDAVLMAGLVDTHVHVNEPGRTEWEGFETATRAAAAGGVTTLVDMPLNSIPATTRPEALELKRATAGGRCRVDVGFWGGVVPGNAAALEPLVRAGALGFKCFLVESGVDEFQHVDEGALRLALPILVDLGVPLLVHAELPGPIAAAEAAAGRADPRRYQTYLASRPAAAEDEAVALLVRLARETRAAVHVVHHSSASALELLARARDEGLPITAETCPHYLHFCAEEIPDGATPFKCAPPIRGRDNRERLWAALASGVLGQIASDHSPCSPALKRLELGDFARAWGGVSSLQLTLSIVWTEAERRGHGLVDLARWLCEAPARLAGLDGRKGAIAPGHDADLVAWRPEGTLRVEPAALHHRHTVTPYAGETLRGAVEATYLRGEAIYDRGAFPGAPAGRALARGA